MWRQVITIKTGQGKAIASMKKIFTSVNKSEGEPCQEDMEDRQRKGKKGKYRKDWE